MKPLSDKVHWTITIGGFVIGMLGLYIGPAYESLQPFAFAMLVVGIIMLVSAGLYALIVDIVNVYKTSKHK